MSIGTQLRAAREARGVSASEAAAATRMKIQHIEALERDDFSVFAAPIYARGFLRTYAAYLGIDPLPLLKEYAEHHPAAARAPLAPSVAAARAAAIRPAAANASPAPAVSAAPDTAGAGAASAPPRVRATGEMEFAFDVPTDLSTAAAAPAPAPPPAPSPAPGEIPVADRPPEAPAPAPPDSGALLFEAAARRTIGPEKSASATRTAATPPRNSGKSPGAVFRRFAALATVLAAVGLGLLLLSRSRARGAAAPKTERAEPLPLLIEPPPEPVLLDPFAPEMERRARP